MFPGIPFPEVCQRLQDSKHRAAQSGDTNETEYTDFVRGRQAIAEEIEENVQKTLPTFVPGVQVQETKAYGHMVYQKAALFTDSEITNHTGKSAQSLGLVPWSTEASAFGTTTNYYVVSLEGLPEELRQRARKVKVFYQVTASRDSMTVSPETQVAPFQATTCFQHVSAQYAGGRPQGILSGNLKTLPELQELATLMNDVMKAQLEEDAAGYDPVAAHEMEQEDASKQQSAARKALAGVSIPEDAFQVKKSKRKAPASTVAGSTEGRKALKSAPDVLALPAPETASSAPAGSVSQTSKRQKERNQELEAMDEEMQKVAKLHCSDKATNSAKSLINLVPEKFMEEGSDHIRGHTLVAAAGLQLLGYCKKVSK